MLGSPMHGARHAWGLQVAAAATTLSWEEAETKAAEEMLPERVHSRQPLERESGGSGQHPFLDKSECMCQGRCLFCCSQYVLQPRLSRM